MYTNTNGPFFGVEEMESGHNTHFRVGGVWDVFILRWQVLRSRHLTVDISTNIKKNTNDIHPIYLPNVMMSAEFNLR